jgi:hypothetical protein
MRGPPGQCNNHDTSARYRYDRAIIPTTEQPLGVTSGRGCFFFSSTTLLTLRASQYITRREASLLACSPSRRRLCRRPLAHSRESKRLNFELRLRGDCHTAATALCVASNRGSIARMRRAQGARKPRPSVQRQCALVFAAATCGTFIALCTLLSTAPPLGQPPRTRRCRSPPSFALLPSVFVSLNSSLDTNDVRPLLFLPQRVPPGC